MPRGKVLIKYAEKRDFKNIKKAIEEDGVDPNQMNSKGYTALINVCKTCNGKKPSLEIAKYLIEHGADPNVNKEKGPTALWYTAWNCSFGIFKLLLEAGADPNAMGLFGQIPLVTAVGKSFACSDGEKMVKLLIKHGADLDAKTREGHTALSAACINRNARLVKLLLEAGADPNLREKDEISPLINAISRKDYGDGDSLKLVKLLVKHGADVNLADDKEKYTPLHSAALSRKYDVVKYLVNKGADVNAEDRYKATPLLLASYYDEYFLIEYLIKKGAKINIIGDNNGTTPLHEAASRGHTLVVELMLLSGADVNIRDKSGMTALTMAKLSGHSRVEKLLIEFGGEEAPPKKKRPKKKFNDPPATKRCGHCNRVINEVAKAHNYCSECKNYYCNAHFKWGKWEYIHIVTDKRERRATCPQGHTTTEYDD